MSDDWNNRIRSLLNENGYSRGFGHKYAYGVEDVDYSEDTEDEMEPDQSPCDAVEPVSDQNTEFPVDSVEPTEPVSTSGETLPFGAERADEYEGRDDVANELASLLVTMGHILHKERLIPNKFDVPLVLDYLNHTFATMQPAQVQSMNESFVLEEEFSIDEQLDESLASMLKGGAKLVTKAALMAAMLAGGSADVEASEPGSVDKSEVVSKEKAIESFAEELARMRIGKRADSDYSLLKRHSRDYEGYIYKTLQYLYKIKKKNGNIPDEQLDFSAKYLAKRVASGKAPEKVVNLFKERLLSLIK